MAEKKVIELEVKTEGVVNLKAELRKAQAEVIALSEKFGATSQEAVNAAKRAAELKDAIGDAKALTDAFNPDAKFNALSSSIGGVLNGFQAYEGALGLIGVESEALQETLLKVQSAMALSQGLQGLLEAKDSFKQLAAVIGQTTIGQKLLTAAQAAGAVVMKALNAVMKANPILLIVSAITAAVAAFAYFTQSSETAEEANEKLNKSLDRQNELFEDNLAKIRKNADNRKRLLEANGASEEELHKDTLRRLREEENARISQMQMIQMQNQQRREMYKRAFNQENYDLAKDIAGKIKEDSKKYKELALNNREYNISVKEENKKFIDEQKEKEKELLDKRKEAAKEAAQARKEAISKIRDAEKEFRYFQLGEKDKEIAEVNDKYDELVKIARKYNKDTSDLELARVTAIFDIEDKYQKEKNQKDLDRIREKRNKEEALKREQIAAEEAYFEQYTEAVLSTQELEIRAVTDKYYTLIEEAKKYGLDTAILEEKQRKEVAAINEKYDKEEAENHKKLQEQKLQAVSTTLDTIGNIAQLFAGNNEKQQKKAFNIQKAASIANATIQTYQSATSAFSALSPIPVVGPVLGAIAAAGAITAGLLNIKKIASTKFEGGGTPSGGGGGSGVGAGAGATSGGAVTPQFNVVGNAQATNPLSGLGNQPIQAYVVSGEVTTAQQLDNNKITYATFG